MTYYATLEARVKVPSSGLPGGGSLYHQVVNGLEDKALVLNSNSEAFGFLWTSPASEDRTDTPVSPSLADDLWHHIAFVRDGSQERMYLDGNLVDSADWSAPIANAGSITVLGADRLLYPLPAPLVSVDWLRISNSARYTGMYAPPPTCEPMSDSNTLALFLFNDPPGSTTATDSGPAAAHGSLGVGFGGATSPVFESPLNICAADFNCDGAVDFFDYDDFVIAFETGDPRADFNNDTAIDFFDYDDFVIAFDAGC
jgi:hypothetical protein